MSASLIARRLAARGLAALAKSSDLDTEIIETARNNHIEVIVYIRPVRYAPTDLAEFLRELQERGLHVQPLAPTSPPVPASSIELREVHERLLRALKPAAQTTRAIARAAGYKAGSSHIRQGLADLVRFSLARHVPGQGYAGV